MTDLEFLSLREKYNIAHDWFCKRQDLHAKIAEYKTAAIVVRNYNEHSVYIKQQELVREIVLKQLNEELAFVEEAITKL